MKSFILIMFLSAVSFGAAYSEVKEFDRVEIVDGYCQIRQATKVIKDGKEIAITFHRWSVEPEGDLAQFEPRVKAICKAAWTPEVIKQFKARKAAHDAEIKKQNGIAP